MDRVSPIAETAYRDLLRMLADDRVQSIQGTPFRQKRGLKTYWYDKYRIGNEVQQTYIGEDTDDLRAAITRHKELQARQKERKAERARLIRILRAEGMTGLDGANASLISALAKAGVFRLGGTLIGTVAFRLYEAELGVRLSSDQLAQTRDLDIASFTRLSLALNDTVSEPLAKVFSDFDFAPVPSLDRHVVWKWKQTRSDLLVEFLTPSSEDDERVQDLPALGVSAQALHHLNFLIASPIKAVVTYRSGVLIQIPAPERYAIHKLIVADRRRDGPDSFKSRKDREQARWLVRVLAEDRPDELAEVYANALSRGPKWRDRIEASLKRLPDVRERLDTLG
ncbi:MAG: GSU2403 family nucleotidyltransferase fold protein [Hyphomonadaceae bacterium]|nr:GSU2403 family nucleotidyltransferase fold protein [Hyphomonadaceae bacterium]